MAAEIADELFVSKLDEQSRLRAKEELHEINDRDRMLAVQTLRQWVLEQDWLRSPTDFAFLLRFLRAKKFSQLEARKLLEHFWKLRSERPKWFSNVDPADPAIQRVIRMGVQTSPKMRDKHNRRLCIFKACNMDIATIKELGVDLVTRALTLIHDWMLMDEYVQVNGLVVLVDYTGASLEMFRVWFHPDKSRDKVAYIQAGSPARTKGLHSYNVPTFFDLIYTTFSPLMSKKLRDRFHVHGKSLVKVYEEVGYECLPDEYLPDEYDGPSAGSMQDVVEYMIEDMNKPEFRDYIRNLSSEKFGVDKNRLPSSKQSAASFRKLNLD